VCVLISTISIVMELYKVYNNSLLDLVTESGLGAHIGAIPVSVPTCADDTAILSNNAYELQTI
jgi:hypothetical protein